MFNNLEFRGILLYKHEEDAKEQIEHAIVAHQIYPMYHAKTGEFVTNLKKDRATKELVGAIFMTEYKEPYYA